MQEFLSILMTFASSRSQLALQCFNNRLCNQDNNCHLTFILQNDQLPALFSCYML